VVLSVDVILGLKSLNFRFGEKATCWSSPFMDLYLGVTMILLLLSGLPTGGRDFYLDM